MKRKLRIHIYLLVLFAVAVGVLAWPREDLALGLIGIDETLSIRRGLDLQGGVYLVYEAEVEEREDTEGDMEEDPLELAAEVIQRRVNPGGASEAIVQTADNDRIVVQLPGVDDPQSAIDLIGRTAQLEFYEINPAGETLEEQLIPTEVNGEDVASAQAVFDQFNRPIVNLQFKSGEGTSKFAEMTTRISQSGNQLLTLLDGEPVFGPASVQQPILTGESQLSGDFTVEEAQETAKLLNAGALPVPVELVAQQTIGPALGAGSIRASFVAAIIGLLGLAAFLIINYRLGGVVAVTAMTLYTATTLTVFKLSTIPIFADYMIVLTLAGIAGFIMSIAVAADANILVLERLREERKIGLNPAKAVEDGFDNAWSSIRDASIATLIICVVLYVLASRFGEPSIQGFALVLGIGVVLNVASVSVVTRTILRGLARTRKGESI